MASLTQWTWVWANSRSWWWTRRPGVLQSIGTQIVRQDWVTELNWILPCTVSSHSSSNRVNQVSSHEFCLPFKYQWPNSFKFSSERFHFSYLPSVSSTTDLSRFLSAHKWITPSAKVSIFLIFLVHVGEFLGPIFLNSHFYYNNLVIKKFPAFWNYYI